MICTDIIICQRSYHVYVSPWPIPYVLCPCAHGHINNCTITSTCSSSAPDVVITQQEHCKSCLVSHPHSILQHQSLSVSGWGGRVWRLSGKSFTTYKGKAVSIRSVQSLWPHIASVIHESVNTGPRQCIMAITACIARTESLGGCDVCNKLYALRVTHPANAFRVSHNKVF